MSSYIRRTSRRATTDARIEDNWVELPTPELALAATHPAIPIPGGRVGLHFGRIGVTLLQAVPHGLSSANTILHGQTARRGSTSTNAGNSNWPEILASDRKGPRTYNALAVVNNLVSAVAFAPNPGSPAPSSSTLVQRRNTSKEKWHDILSGNVVERFVPDSPVLSKGKLSIPPQLIYDDSAKTPTALHRSVTMPLPRSSNRDGTREMSQYVIVDARPPPFSDSPRPLSTAFTLSREANGEDDDLTPVGPQAIIDGLGALCDMAEIQYVSDDQSEVTSLDQYVSCDNPELLSNVTRGSTYFTPTSQRFDDTGVDRKLLVIGSNYHYEAVGDFAYRNSLASLKGAYADTKSLKSAFRNRSYSVQTMVGNAFDRETVLEAVRSFLRSGRRPGDVRAIIFTGHTRCLLSDGTVAIVPPICRGEYDLIPAALWEQTVQANTTPGVIVLSIFASCMAGALMRQKVDLKDVSSPSRDEDTISDAPIFITFASSQGHERSYESTVGFDQDGDPRPGDHFLRALTLAAREQNVTDWHSFMETIQTKFSQLRQIGAICAEIGSNSDVSYQSWLEKSPQQPHMSASQSHLPPFQSVFPSQVSLIEIPETPIDPPVNLAEEFLAHIRLRGEFAEISHYTYSSTNDVSSVA